MKKYKRVIRKYKLFSFSIVFFIAVGLLWSSADAFRLQPKERPVDLVEKGRDIFFNETFDGNGRTCGTHPPSTTSPTCSAFR